MTLTTRSPPARPPLMRLARRIHQQLTGTRTEVPYGLASALDTLASRGQQLAAIRRRLDLCARHQFTLAAAKVHEELQDLLRFLEPEVRQLTTQLPRSVEVLPVPEICEELKHLQDQFPDWRYEHKTRTLIAITEPISLDELYLGPFEIQLDLDRLGRSSSRNDCYRVVAIEPHPASSNESVTHPHVSDQHLCEGEATGPITAALAEGRLGDFFMLVGCVLSTYNPASPYVAIDQWDGTPCHDCGYTISGDESYYCERCSHDFCESCISSCRCCNESRCLGCLDECPVCQERVCRDCLEHCSACGRACCTACMEPDGDANTSSLVCPECRSADQDDGSPAAPPSQGAHHESQLPAAASTPTIDPAETAGGQDQQSSVQPAAVTSLDEAPAAESAVARPPRRRTRRSASRRRTRAA